jgi:hypothetical protein
MGLLSWLNRNADELVSPTIVDRGFKDPTGATGRGRVVGIEQRLDDGTTKRYIAVAHGTRVSGVEIAHGPAELVARLHLGAEVCVRVDGDVIRRVGTVCASKSTDRWKWHVAARCESDWSLSRPRTI